MILIRVKEIKLIPFIGWIHFSIFFAEFIANTSFSNLDGTRIRLLYGTDYIVAGHPIIPYHYYPSISSASSVQAETNLVLNLQESWVQNHASLLS
jgi:hypothetical protein